MDELVVEGVKPWDGRYPFDLDTFTVRHWGWIRRFTDYMPLTLGPGLRGADPELFAAFAVITLHQAGRIEPGDAAEIFERFLDVPFGATVRLEFDPAGERDADDPPPSGASENGKPNDPGASSPTSSEMWAPSSGIPESATSASIPAGYST